MQKIRKIVITIVVVIIFIIVFGLIGGIASDNGRTPGIIGMAALAGFIAALRAIWKKEEPTDKDDNESILQK